MRWVAAALTLVAIAVTSAIILAFAFGGLSSRAAAVSLVLGLGAATVAFRTTDDKNPRRPNPWDITLLILFALASLRAFLWLLYPVGDEWRVLSPNNLGDMSLHLHFIRYLAAGPTFWPESPILAGTPMAYPIGIDLFNSLLLLVQIPVEKGLIWTGLIGAALSAWALWRWGGAFALAALLFNGGLAGFAIFQTGLVADYQAELAWKNCFLSMLVTQRGLLFALPAGLLILQYWRDQIFHKGSGLPKAVALLLYATMPVFSVHAFLFLSLALAALFLSVPSARADLLRFVGTCFLPASLAVFLVTGGFAASSGIRFLPGWMQGDGGLWFWLKNFGIMLPLFALLVWRSWGHRELLAFVGASLVTFALSFLFSFSTWEWDNTKLLLWAWLVCTPFLWDRLIAPLPAFARGTICFLLFFSGAISLVGGLDGRHGYRLANRSELAATAAALAHVPPTDTIAIEPEFNHPVILLGHPVYCGYEGHLFSHGLPYRDKWQDLQTVLKGYPNTIDLARTLDANWLYLRKDPPILVPLKSSKP